jgi:hypothetical protein
MGKNILDTIGNSSLFIILIFVLYMYLFFCLLLNYYNRKEGFTNEKKACREMADAAAAAE